MTRFTGLLDAAKALVWRRSLKNSAASRRSQVDFNPRMPKIIWTCWFQGRENAPPLVRKCLNSWERHNPGWEFRCLNATTIEQYVSVRQHFDLDQLSLTAASLSDIVRILLLHEFGGVWVDATLFCNKSLDDWLPEVMAEGFFAFTALDPFRPLSSWFLSAERGNYLVSTWCRRTIDYWSNHARTDDYFWFHHLFREMCETDRQTAEAWSRVPKHGAEKPHVFQLGGAMYRPAAEARDKVDWSTPVFKLTHRFSEERLKPGSLLEYLLRHDEDKGGQHEHAPPNTSSGATPSNFASLKVSTENLGDHVQIIAGLRMLSRLGVTPMGYIDRDDEIHSAPGLDKVDGTIGILLNGWFKTNRSEWPPHPKLAPLIFGFHARPSFCPELISDESIEFFRRHQPIGCRDVYTETLLRSKGIDVFISNCVSLTLPRRVEDPSKQTEVFVVSRDERIKDHLPASIGEYTYICHYSGSNDFESNMIQAEQLLEIYRSRAKLIVTTLLHCALPAIAMGIPVVVFYPINHEFGHASDRERFSSLALLVPIHLFEEVDSVDWSSKAVDIGELKLDILEDFHKMAAARWQMAQPPTLGPIAPSSVLPPPQF